MTHPSFEVDKLHQVILHLQHQNELLLQRLAQKDREIEELKLENLILHKRISVLEDKLKTNSDNSSLPPSQDPHHKRKSKESSGRKQGGQVGHKPMFRKLAEASDVTKFEERLPLRCPCGHEFSHEDVASGVVA